MGLGEGHKAADGLRTELFGSLLKCFARWRCRCGAANVSRLLPPVAHVSVVACRACRRATTLTTDVATLPQAWGGPEVPPAAAPTGEPA